MDRLVKIVLTGGPCAGKTTLLTRLQEQLPAIGWHLIIGNETATDLTLSGCSIPPLSPFVYQHAIVENQIAKEKLFCEWVAPHLDGNVLVVFDRGLLDGLAYVSEDAMSEILSDFNMTIFDARNNYDGVIHLITAANGAPEAYTLDNNAARTEDLETAREKDKAVLNAWIGHSRLRIINNEKTFDDKMSRAIAEIYAMIGAPQPISREKKFLVKLPSSFPVPIHASSLIQTYLSNVDGIERRVRKIEEDGIIRFAYSEKRFTSDGETAESQKRITAKEYGEMLRQRRDGSSDILKKRIRFVDGSRSCKLDIFSFDNTFGILEVELSAVDKNISADTAEFVPAWLGEAVEVTGNQFYSNSRISETMSLHE